MQPLIVAMLVDRVNRYEVAQWCGGKLLRDGRPGLLVKTPFGWVHAKPGNLVCACQSGFVVYAAKN